jgi:hypothetical protein
MMYDYLVSTVSVEYHATVESCSLTSSMSIFQTSCEYVLVALTMRAGCALRPIALIVQ